MFSAENPKTTILIWCCLIYKQTKTSPAIFLRTKVSFGSLLHTRKNMLKIKDQWMIEFQGAIIYQILL